MDFDSSTKFISSLAKFLQSLCNGYVEFDNGVEVIGHIYLNVDTGKKIDYILNEKVCKTNENSVTFISNSFHAQPAEKPKPTPKPSKAADQDKPSDPGGSQEDDILILEDHDSKPSDSSLIESANQQTSSKTVTPHSASKRSYSQSFHQKNRPVQAKHSRPNPPSVHNPNGAHDTDSVHSDPNNSSSNFLASQSIPTDSSSITAASEADMSHLSQVFPQTSLDSTNNPNAAVTDIKQEPGGDYAVNVKQEFDSSAHGEEDQGVYDEQDQSGYGGMYGDDYYGSGRDPSQRHIDYSQMPGAGQGDFYPGGSGEGAGGDSSGPVRSRLEKPAFEPLWKPGGICPVEGCEVKTVHYRRHWREKHVDYIEQLHCPLCPTLSKRRYSVKQHMKVKHGISTDVTPMRVEHWPNLQFIDPKPLTLDIILGYEAPVSFEKFD